VRPHRSFASFDARPEVILETIPPSRPKDREEPGVIQAHATKPLVAVTGATGYVGGRLVPLLLDAGFGVRCIVREPRKIAERPWRSKPDLTIEQGDLSDVSNLTRQLQGCSAAYYLVHSMESSGKEYAKRDLKLAANFAAAAAAAGVQRIIYLGGLGEIGKGLSEHLSSRREVERVLASTGVQVTVFRAAMVIGSGSASFEILRYLVERLPIMITPSWVKTESQPVAIADVLHWLIRCLSVPETAGKTLEIGGADILPYRELMRIMAQELGLPRRVVVPLPVLSPRLSSGWISLVTPVSYKIARPLAEGLRNRVIVTNDEVQRLMPHKALGVREAIRQALEQVRGNAVDTRWSVAGTVPGDPQWAGGTIFTDERSIVVRASADKVFHAVCRIGGGHGWYAGDVLWRIRGWMDTLVGGPGLRRGRRDADRVEFGETLDFWRVIGVEQGRSLSLLAEMKLPGTATLNFAIASETGDMGTALTMTARFRPKGILGILYWYSVLPLHNVVFGGMLRGIKREAETHQVKAEPSESGQTKPTGYGRARLWLGISGVGTMVVLATVALALNLPHRFASLFDESLASQTLMLLAFVLAYAIVQAPFDLFGGYLLPKRFGRAHPSAGRFVAGLLRGGSVHAVLLLIVGVALLFAGRSFGLSGTITTGVLISIVLLMIRRPLASMIAPLKERKETVSTGRGEQEGPSIRVIESADEGFTGGYAGVIRPREVLLPARWIDELTEPSLSVVTQRRSLAVRTGAWLRGRVLALVFTWTGIALAALLLGADKLGTGEGVIAFSLWFTLWSFLGLLTLPTPSRSGVIEVDSALRASGVDASTLNDAVQSLDAFQDREQIRPAGVETIFHPVPAVHNRIEGPLAKGRRGYLDAARTSVFLSACGLGLLGRAVHCNSGRPALWVFLPSD
jgi:uncharacterized protein YbjT (DUF2867 family)